MAETPSYRVMSVDPKMGDIDEQFALIETERGFGAPASASGMRRIVVGDELPEGSVTAITSEGIRVTPPEEDAPEFVIPLGNRKGYKPPVREKTPPAFNLGDTMSSRSGLGRRIPIDPSSRYADDEDMKALRMQRLADAAEQQGKFYDTDDPNEIVDFVQEDFQDAMENQKTLEMTQTPEGTMYLFQDEDGNLSSYFADDEGDAIRTTPEESTETLYNYDDLRIISPMSPIDVINSILYPFD